MATLSERQCQVAMLIATEGLAPKEVAERLGLSMNTVKRHLYGQRGTDGLLARIGARSLVDVVRWYYAGGGQAVCRARLGEGGVYHAAM